MIFPLHPSLNPEPEPGPEPEPEPKPEPKPEPEPEPDYANLFHLKKTLYDYCREYYKDLICGDSSLKYELRSFIDRRFLNSNGSKSPPTWAENPDIVLARICAYRILDKACRKAFTYSKGRRFKINYTYKREHGIVWNKIVSFHKDIDFDIMLYLNEEGKNVDMDVGIMETMMRRFWRALPSRVIRNKILCEYGFDMDSIKDPEERRRAYIEIGYGNPDPPKEIIPTENVGEPKLTFNGNAPDKGYSNGQWVKNFPMMPALEVVSRVKELIEQIDILPERKYNLSGKEFVQLAVEFREKFNIIRYTRSTPLDLYSQGNDLNRRLNEAGIPLVCERELTEEEREREAEERERVLESFLDLV